MDSKSVARQKIRDYLNNIADISGIENKILVMNELFEYLSTSGGVMIKDSIFRESVRSKLFELFFSDCVPQAVDWYRLIFKCEISQDKPSTLRLNGSGTVRNNNYSPRETYT